MVKATSILMAGITFTGGLLLGFILHLPGASSPHSRHPRSLAESGDHSSGNGLLLSSGAPTAVAMETAGDVASMQGSAPVISSRSLLYLSISPERIGDIEETSSLGEDSSKSSNSDSKQSHLAGSQQHVNRNDLNHHHVERRQFNTPQPGRVAGPRGTGVVVKGKSSGKDYTSLRPANLNSQQEVNSSSTQGGAPAAYKGLSIAKYYSNNRFINNKNIEPSVDQMTDHDKKQGNHSGNMRPDISDNVEHHSGPSEIREKIVEHRPTTVVVVDSEKLTNLDQYKKVEHIGGASTEPQAKHRPPPSPLNSDSNPGQQVVVEEPMESGGVKMSVTVIDIAPGHTGASSSDTSSSTTTLGQPSSSASTKQQQTRPSPNRDLITGDDRQSLVDVNSQHSQQGKPDLNHHMDTNGLSSSGSSSVRFGQQLLDLVSGIYWSPQLEDLTPRGFDDTQTLKWRQQALNGRVKELREGCGRMQNRLVVFDDGTKMCARYRINTDQIQGEVYSYYLAQVLGIQNVPPAVLAKADPASRQWGGVTRDIDSAQWSPQKLLVLTPWLGHLQPVYIPKELQAELPQVAGESLVSQSLDELTELVQWSDLIVLDYLTGNVDRMVNNMFNKQWNPNMMSAPTHNLERVGQAGPIVFLDNESGLLHSYRLLDKYSEYHEKLLRGLCVFRASTVRQIKRLYHSGTVTQELKERFQTQEPTLSRTLSFLPHHNLSVLNQRLAQVYRQILSCERLYANNANS